MSHAMQSIAQQGMHQINTEQKVHHLYAHSLYSTFVDSESEKDRLTLVRNMAVGDARLTLGQFNEEMDHAAKIADQADTLNGWKAPEGAKGQDKYGPKRASFNTVSSMIRQVYGAMVHCNALGGTSADGVEIPATIKDGMGFAKAVQVARSLLKKQGMKWDGRARPTEEEAEVAAAGVAMMQAQAKAAKMNPQKAGETIADFQARMQKEGAEILAEETKKRREEILEKYTEDTIKALGIEDAAELAERIMARWNAYCDAGMAQTQGVSE